ncbi:hypothetical protein F5Y16DRAFT_406115 [Xylariaceae sp. FL0255]|nr:hypothetical protein F5Y16DRAFT_406115 [Xylariaceae sp. FL0255]
MSLPDLDTLLASSHQSPEISVLRKQVEELEARMEKQEHALNLVAQVIGETAKREAESWASTFETVKKEKTPRMGAIDPETTA